MGTFEIIGGKKLKGEITPQGAKNEALQVINAVLLTEKEVIINNIPDIIDVNKLIDLLSTLGVKIKKLKKGSYSFKADEVDVDIMTSDVFKKKGASLRGSIMVVGPLLARFGKGYIPKPGGDKIGRRRLDTHFIGFQNLGAEFDYDKDTNFYKAHSPNGLLGTYMLLDEASVTGTANIIMAANITGLGSNKIIINGVEKLDGCSHTILPDMIEIGSFIGLAAMTQSEILIKNVAYEKLGMIPNVFRKLGIKLERKGDDIFIPSQESYEIESFIDGSIMTISDAPWPGFTPDLLSIILVTATQARGSVLVHQKMFESRLFFVDKLIDMGAQIILCDPHRATVIGLDRKASLRGIKMTSPDIRAGVSLLIAALSAEGKSTVLNIEQIDRGYENIEERLLNLGAQIKRIN